MRDIAVSIIVPFYNREGELPDCLASIECQTLRSIEVLCIDDGSTDASAEVVRRFAEEDERFKLVQLGMNQGAAAARNYAIAQAQGDYLIFMDSDDWYPEAATLEKLYEAATLHKVSVAGGSFSEYRTETGEVVSDFSYDSHLARNFTFDTEGLVDYRSWQGDYGYTRFLFERKLILNNNILFPEYKRQEDPLFFVRAMLAAEQFWAIPDIVYCARVHERARDEFMPREAAQDAVAAICDLIELAAQENLPLVRLHQYELLKWYAFDLRIWHGFGSWQEIGDIVKKQAGESLQLRLGKRAH